MHEILADDRDQHRAQENGIRPAKGRHPKGKHHQLRPLPLLCGVLIITLMASLVPWHLLARINWSRLEEIFQRLSRMVPRYLINVLDIARTLIPSQFLPAPRI